MATEAARLEHKKPLIGRKKKNRLDTHRPSHGRHYVEMVILMLPATRLHLTPHPVFVSRGIHT